MNQLDFSFHNLSSLLNFSQRKAEILRLEQKAEAKQDTFKEVAFNTFIYSLNIQNKLLVQGVPKKRGTRLLVSLLNYQSCPPFFWDTLYKEYSVTPYSLVTAAILATIFLQN